LSKFYQLSFDVCANFFDIATTLKHVHDEDTISNIFTEDTHRWYRRAPGNLHFAHILSPTV